MLDLFTNQRFDNNNLIKHPQFDYIKRSYTIELHNVIDFYNTRVFAVKSNHFLVTLLNQIDVPLTYSAERFIEVTGIRAPFVARACQMTSEINIGKIHDGCFYGRGVKEIIIAVDDYFDPIYANKEWKRISAVTVINHPKSDLGLLLPNGKDGSYGEGIAVIAINIPLLAFQYRCFLIEQLQHVRSIQESDVLSMSHFVHMYVLPNMLFSQFDITLLNRLMNLFYGAPMGVANFKHPFTIINYKNRVDSTLEYYLDIILKRKLNFEEILTILPSLSLSNMKEALLLPDVAPTRQVYWAIILSRLNIIKFLIDINTRTDNKQNRFFINEIQRILIRFKNEKIYETVLKDDLLFDITTTVEEILAI